MAYASIEPFGEERADLRIAINTCVLANINRGKKTPPYKPEDFMPYFDRGRKIHQTVDEQKSILMILAESSKTKSHKKKSVRKKR